MSTVLREIPISGEAEEMALDIIEEYEAGEMTEYSKEEWRKRIELHISEKSRGRLTSLLQRLPCGR